jgi:hypothetical protein
LIAWVGRPGLVARAGGPGLVAWVGRPGLVVRAGHPRLVARAGGPRSVARAGRSGSVARVGRHRAVARAGPPLSAARAGRSPPAARPRVAPPVRAQVPASEHPGRRVPQPVHQGRRQPVGAGAAGGAGRAEFLGDPGQRLFGGDEQGVERRVLHGELAPSVGVPGVPVVGGQPYVPSVVQIRRPVLGRAVVEVGAAEGAGRGRGDPGERDVPAGAVVHALLPGVDHGHQPAAAQVPAVQQIAVPGGQPRVHPGQEAAGARQFGVGAVHQPGRERVDGWLHDPGRLYGARGARRAAGGGGAPEVGAGEVGVERYGGVEDDVRYTPVGPLGGQQRLQLGLRPPRREVPQADRDERRVPGPLVRIQVPGGDGRAARPVGVQHAGRLEVQGGGGGRRGITGGPVRRGTDGELRAAIHSGLPEDEDARPDDRVWR